MERLPCPKCGNKRGLDKSMRVGELEVSSEIFHPKIHFVHV
jgi:predicted nucleic-acid-binding Zn-ribbon protein